MTIRITQPWNGYMPDQVMSLSAPEEARLISLGLATADLDGEPDPEGELVRSKRDPVTGRISFLVDGVEVAFAGPSYAWASKPAAAAGNAGQVIRITDVGAATAGSLWASDGSAWKPVNGHVVLGRSHIQVLTPKAAAPTYSQSGTTITVTDTAHGYTASDNGKRVGIGVATGSLASGVYTGFTYVDANTYTCTATASATTSGNLVGVNTDIPVFSVDIPAGLVGANATLRVRHLTQVTNNANTKQVKLKVGSTLFAQASPLGSTALACGVAEVSNRGAVNSQICANPTSSMSWAAFNGTSTGVPSALAVDFSTAQTLEIAIQRGTAGDSVVLESCVVELLDA